MNIIEGVRACDDNWVKLRQLLHPSPSHQRINTLNSVSSHFGMHIRYALNVTGHYGGLKGILVRSS